MDEVIRESDLIQVDGTIDKLINQLTELNAAYGAMVESVRSGATSLSNALKSTSGATKKGREDIDAAAIAATRYERAQQELAFALSETGKQVAILKTTITDVNRATVDQHRQLQAAIGSYDRIKAEVKELTALYKSLSEAERDESAFGEQVVAELKEKNTQLKELEKSIKPAIEQMTRLQKAEQELAYWQSEEGQKLLEVKRQIREVTSSRKEQKATVDPLAAAEQKLTSLVDGEKDALIAVNLEIEKQTKLRKLVTKEEQAQEGSYAKLSAQYARAKFELEQLNLTLPENEEKIRNLKEELARTYGAMRKFQEETGVYSLGVGDYASGFTGLNMAVQQVVRELPAATVSLNTFFLAISNNIPILADELKRAKLAFDAETEAIKKSAKTSAEAAEQIGKLERPITKVIKSLFSWQTALVLVLTILPKYGETIIEWVGNVLRGDNAARRFTKALKDIRKELENTNDNYGENMVTIRKLINEYRNLSTEADKVEWIKDNEDAWKELNIAIYDTSDAEELFINKTDKVKEALRERARAAAAFKLAEDKYNEQLEIEQTRIDAEIEGPTAQDRLKASWNVRERSGGYAGVVTDADVQQAFNERLQGYENESAKLQEQIDLYFKLGSAAEDAANKKVGTYEDGTSSGNGSGRDVTKYIENTKVQVTKEAEEAITKLQISEFAKRRKEAIKTYNEEVGRLQNTYNENKRVLDGYYKLRKDLSPEQKKALEDMNAQILESLNTYESVYNKTLSDIAKDEKIATAERAEELVQIRLKTVKEGSDEEYRLREQSIENQRKIAKLENQKLAASERQDEEAIDAMYNKQLEDLAAERTIKQLELTRERIGLQLEAVKEGSKAEYELRKSDIQAQMEMEIAQNKLLATEEQMAEEDIKKKYNKQLEDLEYEHQMALLEIKQEGIELRLGVTRSGSKQELDLLLEQIELERQAAIAANKQLAKDLQQSEDDINAYYNRRAAFAQGNYDLSSFRVDQTNKQTTLVNTNLSDTVKYGAEGSRKREVFEIDQNILDIEKQISLYEAGKLELTEEQLANLRLQLEQYKKQKEELSGFKGFIADVAEGGITGGILGALGFDDEAISAFNAAVDSVIENINAIMEAEIEAAEVAVEAAEERVSAAQSAYDAEIEARNNGYANSVDTARKELEQERKNQQEKERILAEAQKRQEQLNAVTQVSSLITAAAQLWSTMSAIPVVGPALAAAAITAMFGSFAYAKVKANQVAAQEYGEGGLEFLEGGSHASGNDIDLHTLNSKGKNMRAEGGEALAIINKRNTKRYKRILPGIIESLNRGTFEDKYLRAFADSGERFISYSQSNSIDLSNLEDDVRGIRKQNETRMHIMPDGTVVIQYKNIKRIIRKS